MRRKKNVHSTLSKLQKRPPQSQKLNDLMYRKHSLIRQYEREDINEEMYVKETDELQRQIDEEISVVVKGLEEKQKKKDMEEHTMADEEKKEGKKKAGRQPRKDSYTMLIVNALGQKNLKNVDEVVAKVDESKPGRDKGKIATQVKTIIYLVKQQKVERWKKYSWNADNFLLSEK